MSDKKKLDGNTPESENYRDEMDELVRIFREELGKAQEEAEQEEELLEEEILEVQGYDPKAVSLDSSRKREVDYENLCDCCGERPRGTKKNPDSIFCEECEAILEKYPYDWKGLVTIILVLGVMIFGAINFAIDAPAFSHMKNGDKFLSEKKYYSAASEYKMAEISIEEEIRENYLNLFAKKAVAAYNSLDMDSALESLSYFDEKSINFFAFKDTKEISDTISAMQATLTVIQQNVAKYEEDDYEGVIKALDALSGRKIYEKNGECFDELDTSYTPDGTETVYICDEGWLNVYKYAMAQTAEKDESVLIEYLEKAIGNTDYIDFVWRTVLASAYISTEQYDKAEALIAEIKGVNAEGIDDELLMSMLYRYRDKDYQKAVDTCVAGLNSLAALEDGYDLVAGLGYTLSMQKTLNLTLLGKFTEAYESAEECCTYQMDALGTTDSQSRDLLAILALATNNTEKYDELVKEIEDAGEYAIPFTQDVTDYKEGKITLEEIVMSGRYDLL